MRRIENEFGTTNHMARSAKQLVIDKGVLSSPNPRRGKSLSRDTVELVTKFYESDEISRLMAGKKDCVTIKVDGKKEVLQKRLLLSNMAEAYRKFKDDHPEDKVGFTKFTELRPKNVVLAGASGTHSVCVHTIHQNVKLMFEGCKIASIPDFKTLFDVGCDTRVTYRHLLVRLSCNPAQPECLLGECMLCKKTDLHRACDHCDSLDYFGTNVDCQYCRKVSKLRNDILRILEPLNIDKVTYKSWVSVEQTALETLTKKLDDFVDSLVENLAALCTHDFIVKQQAAFLAKPI